MSIEQQLTALVEGAASHNIPPTIVTQVFTPVLEIAARPLKYLQYYIFQNCHGDWVLSTLHNPKTQETKTVVYAFASTETAATFQGQNHSSAGTVAPVDCIQLLFRLFALEKIDSLIFLECPSNLRKGKEIQRQTLIDQIQKELQKLKNSSSNIA